MESNSLELKNIADGIVGPYFSELGKYKQDAIATQIIQAMELTEARLTELEKLKCECDAVLDNYKYLAEDCPIHKEMLKP